MTREMQTSAVIGGRHFHLYEVVTASIDANGFLWPGDHVIVEFDGEDVWFLELPVDSETERTRLRVSHFAELVDGESITAYGSASAPVWGY